MLMLFYQPLSFRKLKSIFTESLNDDSCVHLGMFREMLFYQPLSFRKTKTLYNMFEHDDNQLNQQHYSRFVLGDTIEACRGPSAPFVQPLIFRKTKTLTQNI